MSNSLHQRYALLAVLAISLAVRLAAGAWWQQRLPEGQRFGFPDSESYWQLAQALARGEPYEYGAERSRIFRTPGYPLLLAGMFRIVGDQAGVMWGRALSALLGTAAVAGVGGLAWLLFDGRAAVVAAAMAAVYPEAISMSVFVLSEAPFCPLMLAQFICWTLAWRAERAKGQAGFALLGGLLAGLATLMRPSWLLFTPFAIAIGLIFASQRQRQLLIGGTMMLGFCAAMLPWWIRNYAVAGRFVPTSLQVGASLYDGISPTATGASDMRFVPQFIAEQKAADAAAEPPLPGIFEDRLDRRMHAAAVAWAKGNSGRVLQLAGVKFVRMWNPWPNAAELGNWKLRLALSLTFVPAMLLAVCGAWKFAPRDWPFLLCTLPAVYFTLLHMIFVSSIRYRQPAMLTLIVLAAAFVIAWWDAVTAQRRMSS